MNLDEFSEQIRSLQDRLLGSDAPVDGAIHDREMEADEVREAFNVAMEELHTAEAELRQQNEQLRAAQWELEEERRFYRELFEFAPDGYLVTDLHGVIRNANRTAAALLNIRMRFLLGKPLVMFLSEETRQSFRSELHRLARAPGARQYELQLRPRGLPPITASASVLAYFDSHGDEIELRWTIRDVTWRRRVEEQLRESNASLERRVVERTKELEAEFQSKEDLLIHAHAASTTSDGPGQPFLDLVQDLDAIIWTADAATGRFTFVSRGAEALLGYPAKLWVDDPGFWVDHIHPEDREWAVKHRNRTIQEEKDSESEYRMMAADGRQVWFRVSVRVLFNDEGRPRELRGLMVNITKRKKVERQFYAERSELSAKLEDMAYLQELSGRLSATLELQPILEEVLAGVMAVQGSEQGVLKLFDRERNELHLSVSSGVPESVTQFLERVSVEPNRGSCSRVVREGGPIIIENVESDEADDHDRQAARLGGFRAIYSTPLLNRRGEVLGTIASFFEKPHRPPNRQVRLVELFARQAGDFIENARLHRKAIEAGRTRELFLAMLAHELRNPLNSIFTSLELLKLPHLGEADTTFALGAIERQARHLARLVEDLMEASRIAQGKITLHKQTVELIDVVTRAVESAGPAIESRGHELSVSMTAASLPVEADADRLEQVFVNLLTNAAKYTDPGGQVAISGAVEGDQIAIRVRDTGKGIAPELLPDVFDLFAQGDSDPERSLGGMGIGLWLVRNLVERHGGHVTASSSGPGHGSEFVVTLPLSKRSGSGLGE